MRALIFARRNLKEIMRDPFSYVFMIDMPVVLLAVMHTVFYDNVTAFWFSLDMITPGMMVFAYAFTMLYMTILVSRDRTTAFLTRLFTSPMTKVDFILGYAIPGFIMALVQGVCCAAASWLLGLAAGKEVNLLRLLLAVVSHLPIITMFVALGILFGTVFSDKSAPAVASPVISLAGMLSGAWMPVEMYETGAKGFYAVCRLLPFYPGTVLGRVVAGLSENTQTALSLTARVYESADALYALALTAAYAAIASVLAVWLFGRMMTKDGK